MSHLESYANKTLLLGIGYFCVCIKKLLNIFIEPLSGCETPLEKSHCNVVLLDCFGNGILNEKNWALSL